MIIKHPQPEQTWVPGEALVLPQLHWGGREAVPALGLRPPRLPLLLPPVTSVPAGLSSQAGVAAGSVYVLGFPLERAHRAGAVSDGVVSSALKHHLAFPLTPPGRGSRGAGPPQSSLYRPQNCDRNFIIFFQLFFKNPISNENFPLGSFLLQRSFGRKRAAWEAKIHLLPPATPPVLQGASFPAHSTMGRSGVCLSAGSTGCCFQGVGTTSLKPEKRFWYKLAKESEASVHRSCMEAAEGWGHQHHLSHQAAWSTSDTGPCWLYSPSSYKPPLPGGRVTQTPSRPHPC